MRIKCVTCGEVLSRKNAIHFGEDTWHCDECLPVPAFSKKMDLRVVRTSASAEEAWGHLLLSKAAELRKAREKGM